MKKMRRIQTAIALVAVLLCVCIAFGSVKTVHAAAEGTQTETLSLHRKNPDENQLFQMTNLFPGDSETRCYWVQVSYTGTVTVFFQAKADEGDEKLGKVLKMKVRLVETDEVLYEGSIDEMPVLEHELTTDSKAETDELCYEITVSLGTEVGNEYQNKRLTADLTWWAEGSEGETSGTTETVPDDSTVEKTEGETTESSEDDASDNTEGENSESTGGGSGSSGELVDPPDTGDNSRPLMWLICACVALTVMLAGLADYKATGRKRTGKRWLGILPVIFLTLAFGISSFALLYQKVMVEENLFQTGKVNICLNDDEPVFDEAILFEPGMTIVKDFTLRNDSTCDVYYRLYFTNVVGNFADMLEISVLDGETLLFQGKFADLNGTKTEGTNGMLLEGEERLLTIRFHVLENSTNHMQGQTVLFDLNADAVQAVNNPSGEFD